MHHLWRRFVGGLFLFLMFLGTGSQAQLTVQGEGDDLFIQNVTVMTVTQGTLEQGSIWIQNGKIKAVGSDLTVPQGVRIIDGTGRFVIPGIIDSHSHMGIEGGINESSRTVTPEVNIQDVIRHDDISFHRALAGGVTAINTLHGSANPIGGRNAVIKLKFGKPAEELFIPGAMQGIKFALGENPKRSNMTTRTGRRFPASRMGVAFTLMESFTQAKEYMRKWEEYELRKKGKIKPSSWEKKLKPIPPKRDLKLEAMADILKGKAEIICHAYRVDEMLMLMELGDELGFRVNSFEHCLEGYKIADEMARHGVIASIFADSWAYKMEAFDAIPYNAAILTQRGVDVTMNSDSDERVRRLYQDAAKAMKYGNMSETDALKTITLNPAKMLKIDHRVGSIEKGKDADLAIFNGHPFSVYSKVEMTLIEGEIYFDLSQTETTDKVLMKHQKPEAGKDRTF
jgi:imidazolonepropionase-like amidohydrolase